MNIEDIIVVLQNKVKVLENAYSGAIANGEISVLAQLEVEILSTKASLEKINTLK